MRKLLAVTIAIVFALSCFAHDAEAKGRKGSHRVGGANSHGKGSHYVGGHK